MSLLIYEERLELWKGIREQNPRLIIQMRDISLVQNRKVNALTNGCILLLMKNGEKNLSQLYVRKHKSTGGECRGADSQLSWLEIRMAYLKPEYNYSKSWNIFV